MAKTYFDLVKLKKFKASLRSPAMYPVYRQWGKRYLTWTKRRFRKNSAGGGEWPPLKSISYARALGAPLLRTKTGRMRSKSQVAKRRKKYGEAAKKVKILFDTGTLYKALTIYMPGNLYKLIFDGIRVGFANAKVHKKGTTTIQKIAEAHQKGNPAKNLPQRKILHKPDGQLIGHFLRDLSRGLRKIGRTL
jgi:hypothetical protein